MIRNKTKLIFYIAPLLMIASCNLNAPKDRMWMGEEINSLIHEGVVPIDDTYDEEIMFPSEDDQEVWERFQPIYEYEWEDDYIDFELKLIPCKYEKNSYILYLTDAYLDTYNYPTAEVYEFLDKRFEDSELYEGQYGMSSVIYYKGNKQYFIVSENTYGTE